MTVDWLIFTLIVALLVRSMTGTICSAIRSIAETKSVRTSTSQHDSLQGERP